MVIKIPAFEMSAKVNRYKKSSFKPFLGCSTCSLACTPSTVLGPYVWPLKRIVRNHSSDKHSNIPEDLNPQKKHLKTQILYTLLTSKTMPQGRQWGVGSWLWTFRFTSSTIHMDFMVVRLTLGQTFLWVLWSSRTRSSSHKCSTLICHCPSCKWQNDTANSPQHMAGHWI
jgi:hypothetical protein